MDRIPQPRSALSPSSESFRERFVGLETPVPLLDGSRRPYINLDNAASTPPLRSVRDGVDEFLDYYASVHRGTGFKSQLSTWAFEQARRRCLEFVGADRSTQTCVFVKNTTEAINKLARRMALAAQDVVLTTSMEHHSDDLPWRAVCQVRHVGLLPDGRLDEDDFDRQLAAHAGRVRLVAVTGASNVTGYLNPLDQLARKAHAAGAWILADCAQLAPHRSVDIRPDADPEHLDFVALSAHKLYAPYGTGALIGRKDFFETGVPDAVGGGTVEVVTLEEVAWAGPPDREEAGSPNVVGAVALALAVAELQSIGMATVARHEAELTEHALRRFREVPGLRLFGDPDPRRAAERLGVIPFSLSGRSHFEIAAILGHEHGIGVRSGCFCAHPYVLHLLGLDRDQASEARRRILAGDRRDMPGMVRASFGLYNTLDEVDALIEALLAITRGDVRGTYAQLAETGEYLPEGRPFDFPAFLPSLA
jgi:selenocysteine lyase/cysteine desulfurase